LASTGIELSPWPSPKAAFGVGRLNFSLVHLAPLAVALLIAVVWDVWERRIPNAVCAAIAVSGIGVQFWDAGALSASAALGVGVATIAVLMVFWRSGGIGGGDVKLAGAVAVWVGPGSLLTYWLAAALAGGLVAAVCFFASRRAVRREIRENLTLTALHQTMPDVAAAEADGRVSVPYGVAIALGAAFVWWRAL
jgi:prepilin peptidase CpaA